jgi:hypothetical protein
LSEYRTRSLQFAAFVLARDSAGIPEIEGEKGRAELVFDDPDEKLGWEFELFKADTPVGIQQYIWATKELFAQINRKFGPRNVAAVTAGRTPRQRSR